MTREELLTEREIEVMDLTRRLWNAIRFLEDEKKYHPDDIHDHRRDIHDIQNRIMARAYMRLNTGQKQNPSD